MNKYAQSALCFTLIAALMVLACGQDPLPAARPQVQTTKIVNNPSAALANPEPPQAVDESAPPSTGPLPLTGMTTAPSPSSSTPSAVPPDSAASDPTEHQAPTTPTSANSPPPAAPPLPVATPDAGSATAPDASHSAAQPPESISQPNGATETTSDLVQASLQIAGSYDPSGRFDPFEPLFKESPQTPVSVKDTKKRAAQTPLELVALGQLKLSAIIRAPSGNRALVEDATGKGYVVEKGTYMGLNSGLVVQIEKDRLVIEEEVENVMGELTVQATELKLQKPAGEL